MRFISLLAVVVLAACSSPAPVTPTTPTTEQPTTTAPPTTTPSPASMPEDGLPSWTTVGRQYAGPPVGGRGGHYQLDVCPDGSYAYLLLDATARGTWKPGVGGIILNGHGDGEQTLPLSADGKVLNEMTYVGAPSCN